MRLLIAGFLMGIAAAGALPVHAQSAPSHRVSCVIPWVVGKHLCYDPAGVAVAERQAPFAVRPSAAVAATMHVSLSQVGINEACQYCANGKLHVTEIEYLYGKLTGDYGRTPPNPKSVRLIEGVGRSTHFEVRYVQQYRGMTMEISQAALDHPYRWYGPWVVSTNFVHHDLTLMIVANADQRTLEQLAYRIAQIP